MKIFTVRDLREHTGELIHNAEIGKLSLVTKHGRPVFLAVPFTEDILELGLKTSLAIKLFQDEILTLEKASKLAGLNVETFIEKLDRWASLLEGIKKLPADFDFQRDKPDYSDRG